MDNFVISDILNKRISPVLSKAVGQPMRFTESEQHQRVK